MDVTFLCIKGLLHLGSCVALCEPHESDWVYFYWGRTVSLLLAHQIGDIPTLILGGSGSTVFRAELVFRAANMVCADAQLAA